MNEYFELLGEILRQHHGVVQQFQGDAILATFNVPVTDADHAGNAIRAGGFEVQVVNIEDEPAHVLQLYGTEGGDGSFAANCLLARRLVERGVRFVQLYHRAWDHHGGIKRAMEITAKEWEVQREHQDQLALSSHIKAAAAYDAGFYEDIVIPYNDAEEDNNIRRDTTYEKLASLKPVFDKGSEATMTAGNSTPLTDGAAAVLLASEEWARKKNLPISAYLTFAKAR